MGFVILCFSGLPEDGSAVREHVEVNADYGLCLVVSCECECICWLICAVLNVNRQFKVSPTVYRISDIGRHAQ
jgi:hypothetical protein